MVLSRYIFRRYFTYFFLVNIGLTLLYNFIEFFEKLTRIQNVDIMTILQFIILNLLPSFFDLIPLGGWLATCLLFRELNQKKELESFQLLGINPNKILSVLIYCGIFASILGFIGKEVIVYPLSQMSEMFKMEQFKRNTYKRLYNQWFMPKEDLFSYFQVLDIEKNTGEGVSFLFMNNDTFAVEKKIESSKALLQPEQHTVTLPKATSWNYDTSESTTLSDKSFHLPGLFAHLKMYIGVPSLKRQINNLFVIRTLLSRASFNQEIGKLLSRLLSHIQPLIYVILTFCFFFAAPHNKYYKWILILLTYPVFLVLTSIMDFALQHGAPFLVVLFPYLLALSIFASCKWMLIRK